MVIVKAMFLRSLILIILRINVSAVPFSAASSESSAKILPKLFNKRSDDPLIIIINKSSLSNAALRTDDISNQMAVVKSSGTFDETVDEEKTKHYLIDVLRSTGDENDPMVKEVNMKFEHALRSRCTLYFQCEMDCESVRRPKPKNYCHKSCKDVYDHLMLCNPPGGGKKKKNTYCQSDECGGKNSKWSFGKTLPPSWR